MTSLFLITGLIAIAVNVFLGVIVYSANPSKIQNALFAMLTTSFVVWILGSTMVHLSTDLASVLFWTRYSYLGLIFLASIFLHFALSFDKTVIPVHIYLPAIVFSQIVLTSNFLVSEVIFTFSGYSIVYGSAARYFLLYLLSYISFGLLYIFKMESNISRLNRLRMNLIIIGITLPFLFGVLLEVAFPYFGQKLFSVVEYLTIPMAICIFYAFFGFKKEFK